MNRNWTHSKFKETDMRFIDDQTKKFCWCVLSRPIKNAGLAWNA
jgi:hypothetical protein